LNMACNIKVTSSPYSKLNGATIRIFKYMGC
jgi:hypothetical protein